MLDVLRLIRANGYCPSYENVRSQIARDNWGRVEEGRRYGSGLVAVTGRKCVPCCEKDALALYGSSLLLSLFL